MVVVAAGTPFHTTPMPYNKMRSLKIIWSSNNIEKLEVYIEI